MSKLPAMMRAVEIKEFGQEKFRGAGHPPKLVSDSIKEEQKFGGWNLDRETGEVGGW